MPDPNKRAKVSTPAIETSQVIEGQGSVPLATQVSISVPPAVRGEQQVRGQGAMLRGTKFTIR